MVVVFIQTGNSQRVVTIVLLVIVVMTYQWVYFLKPD